MNNKTEHSASHSLASQIVKVYSAIEASSEAIFVTDLKGRIEYANQQFLELNNLSEEQAFGRTISKIPHSTKVALSLMEALKNGEAWSKRHQIASPVEVDEPDDKQVWVRTSVDPITESPDLISGYIGVQRIIHQEVKGELQAKKELGKILGLAIQQEQTLEGLQKSYRAALDQTSTKPEFLPALNHKIQKLSNDILGLSKLLQNTDLSTKQSGISNELYQSSKTLLKLSNNIVDLSQIEAGKLELNQSPNDLRLLIDDVAKTFSRHASDKSLEIICSYPINNHSLYVFDKARLSQILNNLVSNAIKFTEKGEVTIQVIIDQLSSNIRLEVKDTGIGIPCEDEGSIFKTFTHLTQDNEISAQDTGLGLAISQSLTELMDGEIGVNSTFGKGSVFWLEFPFEKAVVQLTEHSESSSAPSLNDHKILVVDDNQAIDENIINLFEQWNMQAIVVNDANTVLSSIEQAKTDKPFSLAVIDSDIPKVNGVDLADKVSQQGIPVIQLNALNRLEETMIWTKAGIKSSVMKPVQQEELYNALLAALSLPPRENPIQLTEQSQDNHFLNNTNILVVEDSKVNQEILKLMLKSFDCKIKVVANGEEVIKLFENIDIPFDLVLMDCQMPVMDGYITSKSIRTNFYDQKDLPIIALTANATPGDRERCIASGMNDYLTKPFTKDQLLNLLKKWLPTSENVVENNVESNDKEPIVSPTILQMEDELEALIQQDEESHSLVQQTDPLNDTKYNKADDNEVDALNPRSIENIRLLQREGAPNILEKIISLYFENSSQIIEEMKLAVEDKNADAVRSTAHSLKSSSSNLGADALAKLCAEMEELGKNNDLEDIDSVYKHLIDQYSITCDLLNKYLD